MQGLAQLWGSMASSNKILITFFGAAIVVAVITLTMVASKPDYAVLFSNLKTADAAAIVQKLNDQKIQYRIGAGGSAIEVPSKDVHSVRLSLAGEGLPAGGSVGFEIFDKNSLGVTDFSQKMNYLRALQGELQRTITSIDKITDARVHIVVPEESLYSENESEATASVLLNVSGGKLNDEEISGIVNLVSASVEGLKPERVTVVDTRGALLSDGSGNDAMGLKMTATQLDVKRNVERSIRQDVETMLDRVVGPGKAVVRVNTRLSFDNKETTRELFEPASQTRQGVVTSEEKVEEVYGGQGRANPGGVPGTAANLQPGAPAGGANSASANNGYRRTQSTSNYSVSKQLEKVAEAPGNVQRVNVAVMLDKTVTMAQVESIRQAVEAAAGIDAARGDKVVVESVEFPKIKEEGKPPITATLTNYLNIGRNALAAILLIVFIMMMKGSLAKQATAIADAVGKSRPAHLPYEATPQLIAAEGGVQQFSENGVPLPPPTLKKPIEDGGLPLSSAQDLAKQNPEDIATVVRTWLSEDASRAA